MPRPAGGPERPALNPVSAVTQPGLDRILAANAGEEEPMRGPYGIVGLVIAVLVVILLLTATVGVSTGA